MAMCTFQPSKHARLPVISPISYTCAQVPTREAAHVPRPAKLSLLQLCERGLLRDLRQTTRVQATLDALDEAFSVVNASIRYVYAIFDYACISW